MIRIDEKGNAVRELAYLVKIEDIQPIPNYDRVVYAKVKNWWVVVRKNEFKIGDIGVYFEIDSRVPKEEPFMFLEKKNFRVKTQKMCKVVSQGLLMSLNDFIVDGITPYWVSDARERNALGEDVENTFLTEILKIKYYNEQDNKRKANVTKNDKYKQMAQRNPEVFSKPLVKWLMRRSWGKKLMFSFLGSKTDDKAFPSHLPFITKSDEERCLIGDTKIHTDQGLLRIADIVNKHLQVNILSYNHEKNIFEYKPINNYQKYKPNILESKYSIEYAFRPGTSRVKHLICTPDHRIYTQRGYIEAKDLKLTDSLLMLDKGSYSGEEILAVIYGMLLGDSHVAQDYRVNGKVRVCTTNGIEQLSYLQYKQSMFAENDGHIVCSGVGSFGVKEKPTYKYFQEVDSWLDQNIKQDWLDNPEKKKYVSQNVVNKLTEASLAFWYMDDGNLSYRDGLKKVHHSPSIRLNTQGFSQEEVELLIDTLINKFNIKCHIQNNKGLTIYISTFSTPLFLEKVTPYMCKSMAYKTLPELEYLLETKTFSFRKNPQLIKIPILKIETIKTGKYVKGSTYDLEVADNHNFIAQGILTHNCENLPEEFLQNKIPYRKTLKIDGTSTLFLLERKKRNKFEFWVCSRNIRVLKPESPTYHEVTSKENSSSVNVYWQMAEKYEVENKLRTMLEKHPTWDYVAIQGETAGVGCQGNPHRLPDTRFYAYNFIDSEEGRWDSVLARDFLAKYNIPFVPIVEEEYILPNDFEEFKLQADGNIELAEGSGLREGYVYRSSKNPMDSFKNVSRKYLLKKKE